VSQHDNNPKWESSSPHAFPDLIIFRGILWTCVQCHEVTVSYTTKAAVSHACHGLTMTKEVGWFWESCTPGHFPDSEPSGPFETEAEALLDARNRIIGRDK
jgi:hypothetical protein